MFHTSPHPNSVSRSSVTPPLHSLNNRYTPTPRHCGIAPSSRHYSTNNFPHSVNSMLDSVQKLSIQGQNVRRCLFPGLEESPGTRRTSCSSSCKENLVGPYPRRRDDANFVTKKSKNRLRRLQPCTKARHCALFILCRCAHVGHDY